MAYSDDALEAMQYNPVALHQYFWRVAVGARLRSMRTKREVRARGRHSPVQLFEAVFDDDQRNYAWAETEMRLSVAVLENIDALVRSCIIRPKVCEACRNAVH